MKTDPTTENFILYHGRECAHRLIRWWQVLWYGAVLSAGILLLLYRWDYFLMVVTFLGATFYLAVILFKLAAVSASLAPTPGPAAAPAGEPVEYPLYTILVPLYREAEVAEGIVAALGRLDYPGIAST